MSGMITKAPNDVDGMAAQTGIPTRVVVMEYANQQTLTAGTGSGTTSTGYSKSYLQGRAAAGISKIAFLTSTDGAIGAGGNNTNRPTYNAYWDVSGNRTGLMSYYGALHTDANVGVVGAAPASTPYSNTYYFDGIHFTPFGQQYMATNWWVPAVNGA
jgi:hypothetical protein